MIGQIINVDSWCLKFMSQQEFVQGYNDVKSLIGTGKSLKDSISTVAKNRNLSEKDLKNIYQAGASGVSAAKRLFKFGRRLFPFNAGSGSSTVLRTAGQALNRPRNNKMISTMRGGKRNRGRRGRRGGRRGMIGLRSKFVGGQKGVKYSTIASQLNKVSRSTAFNNQKSKAFGNMFTSSGVSGIRGTSVINMENLLTIVGDGSNTEKVFSYEINPGLSALFPWLSQIARNYKYYRFRRLEFIYEAQTSFQTNGSVMMGYDYDTSQDPSKLNTFANVTNLGYSDTCDAKKSMSLVWLRRNLKSAATTQQLLVRSAQLTNSTSMPNEKSSTVNDIKFYDCGHLYIGFSTDSTAPLGRLIVTYDVVFYNSQPEPDSLSSYMAINPTGGILNTNGVFTGFVEYSPSPPFTIINDSNGQLSRMEFPGPYRGLFTVWANGTGFESGSAFLTTGGALTITNYSDSIIFVGQGGSSSEYQSYSFSVDVIAGTYFDWSVISGVTVTAVEIMVAPFNNSLVTGQTLSKTRGSRFGKAMTTLHSAQFEREQAMYKTSDFKEADSSEEDDDDDAHGETKREAAVVKPDKVSNCKDVTSLIKEYNKHVENLGESMYIPSVRTEQDLANNLAVIKKMLIKTILEDGKNAKYIFKGYGTLDADALQDELNFYCACLDVLNKFKLFKNNKAHSDGEIEDDMEICNLHEIYGDKQQILKKDADTNPVLLMLYLLFLAVLSQIMPPTNKPTGKPTTPTTQHPTVSPTNPLSSYCYTATTTGLVGDRNFLIGGSSFNGTKVRLMANHVNQWGHAAITRVNGTHLYAKNVVSGLLYAHVELNAPPTATSAIPHPILEFTTQNGYVGWLDQMLAGSCQHQVFAYWFCNVYGHIQPHFKGNSSYPLSSSIEWFYLFQPGFSNRFYDHYAFNNTVVQYFRCDSLAG